MALIEIGTVHIGSAELVVWSVLIDEILHFALPTQSSLELVCSSQGEGREGHSLPWEEQT